MTRVKWALAASVLALAGLAAAWLALVEAPRQREAAIQRWQAQLAAMADDREAALDRWVRECFRDAVVIAADPDVEALLSGNAGGTTEPSDRAARLRNHVAQSLAMVPRGGDYRSAVILDASLDAVATAGQAWVPDMACLELPRRCLATGSMLGDFHLHLGTTPLVDFVAPIKGTDGSRTVGVVVLVVDPEQWLYPFLAHQAVLSDTAETVLMRREGDSVLFLTPLRHRPDSPMTHRRPIDDPEFAAVAALAGRTDFAEYKDYRGVRVFAAPRRLAGVPWAMVTKVDREEVLRPFRSWLRTALFGFAMFLVALVAVAYATWRYQASLVREAAVESESRLGELVLQANDALLVFSAEERVLQANRRAEEMYGYTQQELRRLTAGDLRAPEVRAATESAFDEVLKRDGMTIETLHCRRDGSAFPVEVSVRHASAQGQACLIATVRDVTAQKQAEARITRLNRLLRTISEINQLIVREHDRDRLLARACNVLVEHGEFLMAWVGFAEEATGRVLHVATAGHGTDYVPEVEIRCDDTPLGRGPTGTALRERRAVVANDWMTDPTVAPWREAGLARGFRASAAFPLVKERGPLGALSVYERSAGAFDEENVRLLEELAGDLAFALNVIAREAELADVNRAVRESEDRFRYVFDASPIGKSISYPDGRLEVNQAFADMLGFSRDELQRRHWQEITHPDDIEPSQRAVDSLLSGEREHFRIVKRYIDRNGAIHWADVSTSLRRDTRGSPLYFITAIIDITDRKQAQDELHALANRQQALLAAIPEIVMEVDNDRVYRWANHGGIDFFGDDVVGKPASTFFVGEQTTYARVQPVFNGREETVYVESWQRRRDGEARLLAWWCRSLRGAGGSVVGAISTARDITQQRQAEDALQHAHDELERRVAERTAELAAANRELEAFAYSVSHDLRVPLRAVDGFSRLLIEEHAASLDGEARRLLGVVREQTLRMGQLIDDLLAFSRAGRTEMAMRSVDMRGLVGAAVDELTWADRASADVTLGEIPAARGDERLLHQVWMNLISNALKFHAPGAKPRVEISGEAAGDELVYTVRDRGVGFDMRYADKLFRVFQRLHSIREFPGTGVGLALVQRIVQRHGGRVWAEGTPGEGATFWFSLPCRTRET